MFKYDQICNRTFWLAFCLGMAPYFAGDMISSGVPINLALMCCLIIAVPVLSAKEATILYGIFLAENLTLCVVFAQPVSSYLFAVALIAGGLFLSQTIQSQYINVIAQLKQENGMDFLTGILNRKGDMEKLLTILEICKRHKKTLCVCMVDIDHFKEYNDAFGHMEGDETLKMVAACLNRCFSRASDVVCRFGGEEFLVCFTGDETDHFEQNALRICQAIRALKIPAGSGGIVTASVGMAVYLPTGMQDPILLEELSTNPIRQCIWPKKAGAIV